LRAELQCVNLELSKKLLVLGVKQESLLYWHNDSHKTWTNKHPNGESYSAYTASELLELLPAVITSRHHRDPFNNFWLNIKKRSAANIKYIANYICETYGYDDLIVSALFAERALLQHNVYDESFANMLAKLLIELINVGHVKINKE
jgi:hypothetical protein